MPTADPDNGPGRLLDIADMLLRGIVPGTRGLWPRAVAFLVRTALEETVAEYWSPRLVEMRDCSMRAQLLCLREYADPTVAFRAAAAWGGLSQACHYHTYALAPTAGELRGWHLEVSEVRRALGPVHG